MLCGQVTTRPSAMRLLVVEDDALTARSLQQALAALGNTVDTVSSCATAQAALDHDVFDLILLDLGLPDGDGLDVVTAMRQQDVSTPVLILTARGDIHDRVKGLDLGADDYLAKPFSLSELQARVRALLRRNQQRVESSLALGPLRLEPGSGSVTLNAMPLALPRREVSLLEGLLLYADRIAPREILENRVFGYDAVGSNALDVYISRLRKRLRGSGLHIKTLRGMGYRLEEE